MIHMHIPAWPAGATRAVAVAMLLLVARAPAAFAESTPETAAILKVMRDTWERPDAKLEIAPIVAADGYAIASWTQGDLGGRALLQEHGGQWQVLLCSGDPLLDASTAKAAGVPAATADRLIASLRKAEEAIPEERRKQFASFQGLVRMGEGHPQGHHPK